MSESFWLKVRKHASPTPWADDGTHCWEWLGTKLPGGYGRVGVGRRAAQQNVLAHRRAYALLVEPCPPGLDLDHLCRNRGCVNPAHLEPVTRKENMRRSPIFHLNIARAIEAAAAKRLASTLCKHGHAFDRLTPRGSRVCSTCKMLNMRKLRAAKREHRMAS